MVQQQLEYPPALNVQDMWHLADGKKRWECILPGASLDINWLIARTKQDIVEAFYTAAAEEKACHLPEYNYTTKSRWKLPELLVTYYIVYAADCGYLTLRHDSVVKHLNLCHNRYRSIT